jgi:cystathionine beta-lyase/cystathionine gamma-synthase
MVRKIDEFLKKNDLIRRIYYPRNFNKTLKAKQQHVAYFK